MVSLFNADPIRDSEMGFAIIPLYASADHKKRVIISIPCCKIDESRQLPGAEGAIYSFNIPADSVAHNRIMALDEEGIKILEAKNAAWFNNSMTADQIERFFRPSMTGQNSLRIPEGILTDIDTELGVGSTVTIELSLVGLIVYPQTCGLKWKLASIHPIVQPETFDDDGDGEVVNEIDKEAIETDWCERIAKTSKSIAKRIAGHQKKIMALQTFEQTIKDLLADAISEELPNSSWDAKLVTLQNKLGDFNMQVQK